LHHSFDLLFLLLDRPSEANDRALARHVTYVHMFSEHPPLDFEPIPMAVIRCATELPPPACVFCAVCHFLFVAHQHV
jgi:hypothetical protein